MTTIRNANYISFKIVKLMGGKVQMKAKGILIIFFLLSIFLFSGCTGSPFSDNEIPQETRRITGKVEISDNTHSPEGVYVWLGGFDIGTFTDQDGEFEITLPSTAQNSGGPSRVRRTSAKRPIGPSPPPN